MNILHTADWHLGQTFYQYDRYEEHQHFLDWLLITLEEQAIDVLLISGDVFDTANPSVAATQLFYHFLHQATERLPALQIIAIAGNHDSPVRLEMPTPLLEDTQVHLVGTRQVILPLYKKGEIVAYCLAVPFVRLGDYPRVGNALPEYTEGVAMVYRLLTEEALAMAGGLPLIAMGHLHAWGAEIGEDDTAERPIVGGIEGIKVTHFPTELQYIALGHIHKAQVLGGKEHIRYAGSPIPLSFAEKHYEHQVVVFSLDEGGVKDIKPIAIPLHTPLLSIPEKHQPLREVLEAISSLAERSDKAPLPYVEVRVLLDEPTPELKSSIIQALSNKQVRLARIDARYKQVNSSNSQEWERELFLEELSPLEVLEGVYKNKYGEALPEFYQRLFREAEAKVQGLEN